MSKLFLGLVFLISFSAYGDDGGGKGKKLWSCKNMDSGDAKKICRQNRKIFKLLSGNVDLGDVDNGPIRLMPGKYKLVSGQCDEGGATVDTANLERVRVEYPKGSKKLQVDVYKVIEGEWKLASSWSSGWGWTNYDEDGKKGHMTNFHPNSSKEFTNGSGNCTYVFDEQENVQN